MKSLDSWSQVGVIIFGYIIGLYFQNRLIGSLKELMLAKFETVKESFETVNQKFETVYIKFKAIEDRLDKIEKRLDKLEEPRLVK